MKLLNVFLIGLLLTLGGCGGKGSSSGENGSNQSSIKTGIFLDSPVINIGYRTETKEGVTNSLGEYEYVEGESVTFFIGDLDLPTVSAMKVVTPLDIAKSDNTSDPEVINIIRLLQTLDEDGNPDNGIVITDNAKSVATQVDFSLSNSAFESSDATLNLVANSGATNVSLISSSDAVAHFEATLSATPLASENAIEIPSKLISIDGNNNDWSGVQPIGFDQTGDQNGNSSTDLVKVAIARSGENIALLIETSGDISLYHTPGSDYSHYEIGFHFYNDSNCAGDDNGFFIVNNFTDSSGKNYHRIDGWFNDSTLKDISNQQTSTAHKSNVLETSFSSSLLPKDKGLFISLNPYVQSFIGGTSTFHDNLKSDICFQLPAQ